MTSTPPPRPKSDPPEMLGVLERLIEDEVKQEAASIKATLGKIFLLLGEKATGETGKSNLPNKGVKVMLPETPTFHEKDSKKRRIPFPQHLNTAVEYFKDLSILQATNIQAVWQMVRKNAERLKSLSPPQSHSIPLSDSIKTDVRNLLGNELQEAKQKGKEEVRAKKTEMERERSYYGKSGPSVFLIDTERLLEDTLKALKEKSKQLRDWRKAMVELPTYLKGPVRSALRIMSPQDLKLIQSVELSSSMALKDLTFQQVDEYSKLPDFVVFAFNHFSSDELKALIQGKTLLTFQKVLLHFPQSMIEKFGGCKRVDGDREALYEAITDTDRLYPKREEALLVKKLNLPTFQYLQGGKRGVVASVVKAIRSIKNRSEVLVFCKSYQPSSQDPMKTLADDLQKGRFQDLWITMRKLDETYVKIGTTLERIETGVQKRCVEGAKNRTYRLKEYRLRTSDWVKIMDDNKLFHEIVDREFEEGTKACNQYLSRVRKLKFSLDGAYTNAISELAKVHYALHNKCVPYSNSSLSVGAYLWGNYIKKMLRNLRNLKKEFDARVSLSGSEGSQSEKSGSTVSKRDSESDSGGKPTGSQGSPHSSRETQPQDGEK